MRRETGLGRDPMAGLLLRLAVPAMLAQFVNVLYSIVDRMFIGHIAGVGGLALAGVGVCGPIITLLSGGLNSFLPLGHMMPGFDGVETLKKVRELQNGAYQDLPVIALTANTVSGARKMFRSEGYQNALEAAKSFENVTVIDSGHLSSSLGLMVLCGALLLQYIQNLVRQHSPFERVCLQKASFAVASNCGPGSFGLLLDDASFPFFQVRDQSAAI